MLKKSLIFVSFCFLQGLINFSVFGSDAKNDLLVEDLHIFNILQNAKVVLMEDIVQSNSYYGDDKTDEMRDIEKKSLALVDKEILLLREIVQGFNQGNLIFIGYRFLAVCNFLRDMDTIKPRDIRRAFKRKVTNFDNFIRKYKASKQGFMEPEEVKLCEKILLFNHVLLAFFLRHDFYDVALHDEIIDVCFFKPIDFMSDHPVLTGTVAFILFSIAFSFYVYPYLQWRGNDVGDLGTDEEHIPVDEDLHVDPNDPVWENKNPDADIAQLKVFRQTARTCGANLIYRLFAFHESGGDVKKAHEIANDVPRFNKECKDWIAILGRNNLNDLGTEHFEQIIKFYNSNHPENPVSMDNVIFVDDAKGLKDINDGCFAEVYGINDTVDHNAIYEGHRSRFQRGQNLYFLINTAEFGAPKGFGEKKTATAANVDSSKSNQPGIEKQSQSIFSKMWKSVFGTNESSCANGKGKSSEKPKKKNRPWVRTSYGHWLPFMFVHDPSARDGVRVLMSDSLNYRNLTNDAIVTNLHHMLVHGS